jgi:hypothetical protein
MIYTFGLKDQIVVRLECNNDQRMGEVESIAPDGTAMVKLIPHGRIKIWPTGYSSQGLFTVIKHVPYEEFLATGKV